MSLDEKMHLVLNWAIGYSFVFIVLAMLGFLVMRIVKSKSFSKIVEKYFSVFGLNDEKRDTPEGFLLSTLALTPVIVVVVGAVFGVILIGDYISQLIKY